MAGLAFGLLVAVRVCKGRITYELQTSAADARREGGNTAYFSWREGEKQQLVIAKSSYKMQVKKNPKRYCSEFLQE